ncbi:hypothetical protein BTN49_1988 [Candidatus Enterovibrio escicola]|uniref:Uncharacterized protein n=1 Tax=Candidatus Enterovibrio escicola TaxID=1927127 RepID=A0A2A5T2N9_9GAMM|nr:hypothetical protein BTN49_1988 [Candidatus Enterovibrio escacola]
MNNHTPDTTTKSIIESTGGSTFVLITLFGLLLVGLFAKNYQGSVSA